MSIAIATTKYLTLLFTLCDLRKNANQKTRLMNSWVLRSFLVRTSRNVKHTRKDFKRKRNQCFSRLPYVILLVAPLKLRLLHASSTTRTFVARDWIVAFGGLIVLISSLDYSRSRGRQLLQFYSRLAYSTS